MKPIFSIESLKMFTKLIKDELSDKNIFSFSAFDCANGRESKARAQILNEIMSNGGGADGRRDGRKKLNGLNNGYKSHSVSVYSRRQKDANKN